MELVPTRDSEMLNSSCRRSARWRDSTTPCPRREGGLLCRRAHTVWPAYATSLRGFLSSDRAGSLCFASWTECYSCVNSSLHGSAVRQISISRPTSQSVVSTEHCPRRELSTRFLSRVSRIIVVRPQCGERPCNDCSDCTETTRVCHPHCRSTRGLASDLNRKQHKPVRGKTLQDVTAHPEAYTKGHEYE